MEKTADEAKANAVQLMGAPLGEVYSALWQETAVINSNWAEYVELYGTKESRIHLLNQAAPRFASLVQDTLWESVVLHIARLTDPPHTGHKENLSFLSLAPLIDHAAIQDPMDALIARAISEADFARDWRNRHLAHRDLQLALKRPATPLKSGSRLSVKTVLGTFSEILNVVSADYMDSTTFWDFHGAAGGATSLLYVVDDGLAAARARRERLRRGEVLPDDYSPKDL